MTDYNFFLTRTGHSCIIYCVVKTSGSGIKRIYEQVKVDFHNSRNLGTLQFSAGNYQGCDLKGVFGDDKIVNCGQMLKEEIEKNLQENTAIFDKNQKLDPVECYSLVASWCEG